MKWIGILLVSPFWGILSTLLFIHAWMAVADIFILFLGLAKGTVHRVTITATMGGSLFNALLFSLFLYGGNWLLTEVLPFGKTETENVVYWIFAGFSALYMLPRIPVMVRKSWRHAMTPGSIEMDNLKQAIGRNSEGE